MTEFFSNFAINEDVEFVPMYRHLQAKGIAADPIEGKVIGVRFTEAKVFYDVFSPYWGCIFDGVASGKVFKISKVAFEGNNDVIDMDQPHPLTVSK